MFLFLNRPFHLTRKHRFAEKEDAKDHDDFTHADNLRHMQRAEKTQMHDRDRHLISAQKS